MVKQQSYYLITAILRGHMQGGKLLPPFRHIDFSSKIQQTPYDDQVVDTCSNKEVGTQVAIRTILMDSYLPM